MIQVRKTVFLREVIETDPFGTPCEPLTRVAAAAVFTNPLAGHFETDRSPLFEIGAELGKRLAGEAVSLLNAPRVSKARPLSSGLRAIWNMAAP